MRAVSCVPLRSAKSGARLRRGSGETQAMGPRYSFRITASVNSVVEALPPTSPVRC